MTSYEGDSDTEAEVSNAETQFVPRSDDELWDAIEILGENKSKYRIRWAGTDPKTRKPYKPTWEFKHDCTPDLVKAWKQKQALKKAQPKRKRAAVAPKTLTSRKNQAGKLTRTSTTRRPEEDEEEKGEGAAVPKGRRERVTFQSKGKQKAKAADIEEIEAKEEEPEEESSPEAKRGRERREVDSEEDSPEPLVKIGPPRPQKRRRTSEVKPNTPPRKRRRLPSLAQEEEESSPDIVRERTVAEPSSPSLSDEEEVPVKPAWTRRPKVRSSSPPEDLSTAAPSQDEEQALDQISREEMLIEQMEESLFDLEPRFSPHPLRVSQQEVIEETIYPQENSIPTMPSTASTQRAMVDSQSQPHTLTKTQASQKAAETSKSSNIVHHVTFSRSIQTSPVFVSPDFTQLQVEHTTLLDKYEDLAENLGASEDRVAQLEEMLARIRSEGLATIRQTFESRVQALESEVAKAKDLNHVLTLKDQRTNDDVRRRAACEPELRARNVELEKLVTHSEEELTWLHDKVGNLLDEQAKLQAIMLGSRSEMEKHREERDVAIRSLETIRIELSKLRSDAEELQRGKEDAERMLKTLREENERLESEIQRSQSQVSDLQEQLQTSQRRLSSPVSTKGVLAWHVNRHPILSLEPVKDDEVISEHPYTPCQVIVNGQRCAKRFMSSDAVVRHAFAEHYKMTIDGILS